MKVRWKWIVAALAAGLAGYLGWVAVSDPTRGVAIQFLGYQNSGVMDHSFPPRVLSGEVTARFCLTNGSRRAIACNASGNSQAGRGAPDFMLVTKTRGRWNNASSFYWGAAPGSWGSIVLKPGDSVCFSARDHYPDKPLRVTIAYSVNPTNVQSAFTQGWRCAPFIPNPWSTAAKTKPTPTTWSARLRDRVAIWMHWNRDHPSVSITIQEP